MPRRKSRAGPAKLHTSGVVAFGMGGDELSFPAVNFRAAFDLARNEGLHIVCHAGEIGGPESVREAVEILGAERIGHGIAVMHDPALAESLALRRIVLENCPTSNLCTGALAKQIGKKSASLADHPLPQFIERGLPVMLSTDDPALFHTDLAHRIFARRLPGLSSKQLLQLAEQSFNAAFFPRSTSANCSTIFAPRQNPPGCYNPVSLGKAGKSFRHGRLWRPTTP